MRALFPMLVALAVLATALVRGDEPFLKPADVIAFVGGEDMVAMVESGRLELLLTRAMPDARLKFRSLAWEGDTVFEQWRDLNYPTLEQQLDEIDATVVIAGFGQMESLAGPGGLPDFVAAYEKLTDRLGGGGKRRVVLLGPVAATARFNSIEACSDLIRGIARRKGLRCMVPEDGAEFPASSFRDGLHLNEQGHNAIAVLLAHTLGVRKGSDKTTSTDELRLADAIGAKNCLWFHYARPQNWAFLNGDRTTQPSSRDHIDPSKRWFPEEMKQWLPLVAAKEQEISKLARQMGAR